MELNQICTTILEICDSQNKIDKFNKDRLAYMITELGLMQKFNENKIYRLIETHKELAKINNRKATQTEIEFTNKILSISIELSNENHWLSEERRLKIKGMLRDYVEKIIKFESQKPKSYRTKRIEKRIAFATELLSKIE